MEFKEDNLLIDFGSSCDKTSADTSALPRGISAVPEDTIVALEDTIIVPGHSGVEQGVLNANQSTTDADFLDVLMYSDGDKNIQKTSSNPFMDEFLFLDSKTVASNNSTCNTKAEDKSEYKAEHKAMTDFDIFSPLSSKQIDSTNSDFDFLASPVHKQSDPSNSEFDPFAFLACQQIEPSNSDIDPLASPVCQQNKSSNNDIDLFASPVCQQNDPSISEFDLFASPEYKQAEQVHKLTDISIQPDHISGSPNASLFTDGQTLSADFIAVSKTEEYKLQDIMESSSKSETLFTDSMNVIQEFSIQADRVTKTENSVAVETGNKGSDEGEGHLNETKENLSIDTENKDNMSEIRRGNLDRSMEKSFEDLLTGLESDGEPDIDDIINNCDLPENVTDVTFNAMATANKRSYESKNSEKQTKQKNDTDSVETSKKQSKELELYESNDQPTNGHDEAFNISGVERVSFFSDDDEDEEEGVKNDDPGVHSPVEEKEDPFIQPREAESSEEEAVKEEQEEAEIEEEKQSEEQVNVITKKEEEEDQYADDLVNVSVDTTNLTSTSMTFQGIDQEDSDPDIDELVEDCAYLPETVTDSTINFMVQSNKPVVQSYRDRESSKGNEEKEEEEEADETAPADEKFDKGPEVVVDEAETIHGDPSMDFTVLEQDTSHLDVDIGKQKTNLRKKGSLAKRRKPTRANVRSALLSAEEDALQDILDDASKIEDKETEENGLISPPAKKPNPTMVALPGLTPMTAPRPRRSTDEEDMVVDNTPKKNYKNIGIKLPVPQQKLVRKESTGADEEEVFTFEKPSLKKVEKPTERLKSPESEKRFEKPALKSVPKDIKDRKSSESDSEKFFNKPALRQVTREEGKVSKPFSESESSSKFEVPSLRNVTKKQTEVSTESEKRFEKPSLRAVSVERSESGKSEESDKTFIKPTLKTAPKPYLEKSATPKSPEGKTFELPSLRRTPKVERGPSETSEKVGLFDKPSLRNVSRPLLEDKNTNESSSENKYRFDKPTLRNVPRDSLPTQTELTSKASADSEEKYKFDVPVLRTVSKEVKSEQSDSYKNDSESMARFRNQLRSTPRKEVSQPNVEEKPGAPSWLTEMKLKRTKSQSEDVNDIENQNRNNEDKTPSWGDRDRLRKTSQPLQENTDNIHSLAEDNRLRKRTPSIEAETNGVVSHEKSERTREPARDKYVPSWMKNKESAKKSNPNLNFVSPPGGDSSELPQWKRDLAERRRNRKDSDTPAKPLFEEKTEPSWKQQMKLKPATPSQANSSTRKAEPEWKQKAEEKRQRIIRLGSQDDQNS